MKTAVKNTDVQMVVSVVLPAQLGALLDEAARREGRSRANYVKRLLEQHLQKDKSK